MGVNLILCKNDGEYVADLGRSYHYQDFNRELDIDYDKLDRDRENIVSYLTNKIENFKAYMQGRQDIISEMYGGDEDAVDVSGRIEDMVESLFNDVYDMAEELENIGKKKLLAYILEEDHLTYRVE